MKVEPRPVDAPAGSVGQHTGRPQFGSDIVADMLRLLGIEYAAMLPGSSYRGIHDSIVNYGGNRAPQLILCGHEMITAGLARGYARVTGKPMAVLLHNIVGLLNGSMNIYDAWCDRVPMLVLGGTGPLDAATRRPWIDWIHTATDQGALVRPFVKWDDQPGSVGAIAESLLRAYRIAVTDPPGPVYLTFDITGQEERVPDGYALPDVARYAPAAPAAPDPASLRRVAELLVQAELPVAFPEGVGRDPAAVRALVELAELLAMPVFDAAVWWRNFPTPHPQALAGAERALLPRADVVLGLDPIDLARALRIAGGATREGCTVIAIGQDELAHRGLTADYEALPAIDLPILGSARRALPLLLEAVRERIVGAAKDRIERRREALAPARARVAEARAQARAAGGAGGTLNGSRFAAEVAAAVSGEDVVFVAGAGRRLGPLVSVSGPEADVSGAGSASVGAATSAGLGAALALKGSGKLPVALVGDGDFLMAAQGMWTAAHYGLGGLWVIANNRSYFNDEEHQGRVAKERGRPEENRWIGQRLEDPEIDFAGMARTLGVEGLGPIDDPNALAPALARAAAQAREGATVVVDVRTVEEPRS